MDDKQTFYNSTNIKTLNHLPNESDRMTQASPKPSLDVIISDTIEDLSPLHQFPYIYHVTDPRYTLVNSHSWPLSTHIFPSALPIVPTLPHLPSIQEFYKRPNLESNTMLNGSVTQEISKRMKLEPDEVIDLSDMNNFTDGNNNNHPIDDADLMERKNLKFFDLTSEGPSLTSAIFKSFPYNPQTKPPHGKHKHNDIDKDEWVEVFKLVKEQVQHFRNKEGKSKAPPGEFKKTEFPRFLHDDKLRSWLNHQCKLQKQGGLSKEQHDMLVDIGFDFMQRRALRKNQWDEQYEKLKQLKDQYGTCEVPAHFADKGLKVWVNDQRKNYRNGALRKNKVDMLNALGFSWEAPSRIAKSSSHEMDSESSVPPNSCDPPPVT